MHKNTYKHSLLHIFKDIPEMCQENGCEVCNVTFIIFVYPFYLTVNVMFSVKLQLVLTCCVTLQFLTMKPFLSEIKMDNVMNNCSEFGNQSYRYYILSCQKTSSGK